MKSYMLFNYIYIFFIVYFSKMNFKFYWTLQLIRVYNLKIFSTIYKSWCVFEIVVGMSKRQLYWVGNGFSLLSLSLWLLINLWLDYIYLWLQKLLCICVKQMGSRSVSILFLVGVKIARGEGRSLCKNTIINLISFFLHIITTTHFSSIFTYSYNIYM